MLKEARHREILEMLHGDGSLSVADLANHFDVTDVTIRRDLSELEQQGLLRRVHGGAITNLGRSYEPPYQLRSTKYSAAKEAIGRAAAAKVLDGDSIALDVGTTTLEIVPFLRERKNLTIITASFPIATRIIETCSLDNDVRLILTGGIVRSGELSMIGGMAQEAYRNLHVDKAFLGVGGLSIREGLTDYNLEDADVKKPLLRSARYKVIVADGSKFGRLTFASVGSIDEIDAIITDESAPFEMVDKVRQLGVEVIVTTV